MVNVYLKDTSIVMFCDSAEDLYSLYFNLGDKYTFIVENQELEKMGTFENGGQFAGYTKGWFKKRFFDEEDY